ncbi:hypothetical protein, partial [Methanopyrus sp.]
PAILAPALLALLAAGSCAKNPVWVDVYPERVGNDRVDLLYLVYVVPGEVRVALPPDSRVQGAYFFTVEELRGWKPNLPPRFEWERHRFRGWRLATGRLEWGNTVAVEPAPGVYVKVPIEGVPEDIREAFVGLLERGRVEFPVLEARVDRKGLLVIEVRTRPIDGRLILYINGSGDVEVEASEGKAYSLNPRRGTFVLLDYPGYSDTLVSIPLSWLKPKRPEVKFFIWPGEKEGEKHPVGIGLIAPAALLAPALRRRSRRWTVLALPMLALALSIAAPGPVHANPVILPPRPPASLLNLPVSAVVKQGQSGARYHVFVRLWPGVETTVYAPASALVRAAVVPADAVLSARDVNDVLRWCEEHHAFIKGEPARLEISGDVLVVWWWDRKERFRTTPRLLQESLPWVRELARDARAFRVKADDDAFLYLLMRDPVVAARTDGLANPGEPMEKVVLAEVDGTWYVLECYSVRDLQETLGRPPRLLALKAPVTKGLNTNQLWEEDLRRLSKGPEVVIVRSVRGGEALVDVVATVPEVPLPAGARILKCGTVPRDAYRDAYTGALAPGFQPARYRVVREGEASVPEVGTLKFQVIRADLPRGRLLLIRTIVPLVTVKVKGTPWLMLAMPVVKGGTSLGLSTYRVKEAEGFEWLVGWPHPVPGFRKFVPPKRPRPPISLREILAALAIAPLLLPVVWPALEPALDRLPYPIREPVETLMILLLGGYMGLLNLLAALLLGKPPIPF